MAPRVLFVSKPIVAPFFDGTKCIVRDVSTHLTRHEPQVMGTPGERSAELAPRAGGAAVRVLPVYRAAGSYAPALADNARAAAFLLLRARADVWHFVFAPNPRSSTIGRIAKRLRRASVVQTVASRPRHFSPEIFFGDIVVAQSRSTRDAIADAFRAQGKHPPRLEVIPPPVGPLCEPSEGEVESVRRALDLPRGAVVFTYPGDLEVSCGAETVRAAVEPLLAANPGAVVVFACRPKTADAPRVEQGLRARVDPARVRFVREVDMPALLRATNVVLFPVDDLRGKVDVPIVVLEAMRLGVPVVALDAGPLSDLESGAHLLATADPRALSAAATRLVRDAGARAALVERGHRAVAERYAAPVVAAAYERLYDALLAR